MHLELGKQSETFPELLSSCWQKPPKFSRERVPRRLRIPTRVCGRSSPGPGARRFFLSFPSTASHLERGRPRAGTFLGVTGFPAGHDVRGDTRGVAPASGSARRRTCVSDEERRRRGSGRGSGTVGGAGRGGPEAVAGPDTAWTRPRPSRLRRFGAAAA